MDHLKFFKNKQEGDAFRPYITSFPFVGYALLEQECLIGSSTETLRWYNSYPHICDGNNMTTEEVVGLINHALNTFLYLRSDDGEINTHQEMIDYIQQHDEDYNQLADEVNKKIELIPSATNSEIDSVFGY